MTQPEAPTPAPQSPPPRGILASLKIVALGFVCGVVILGGLRAWQNRTPSDGPDKDALSRKLNTEMQEMAGQIKASQGHSRCNQSSDCKVVGLGTQVCKGYKNFVIYSNLDADEGTLLYAVKKFNAAATKLAALSLESSGCGDAASEIVCFKNRCMPRDETKR